MEQQFAQDFIAFRDRLDASLPAAFQERERGVLIAGRGCALAAGYSLSQEKKMFGVIGTGSYTHSHELRLLFSAPGLRGEQLPDWQAYAKAVLEERLQLDRAHEFSILSIILAVDAVEKTLIKALKKADFEQKYAPPGAGWVQIRFVAADLTAKRFYASPFGKTLVNLMQGLL